MGIFLTNQTSPNALFDENGANNSTAQWIGYSFLQFIFMYDPDGDRFNVHSP